MRQLAHLRRRLPSRGALLAALLLATLATAHAEANGAAPAVRITSIAPAAARPGDRVTVIGRGLGSRNVRVTVGGVSARVIAAWGPWVTFRVPATLTPGPTVVAVTGPGGHGGTIAFRVLSTHAEIVTADDGRAASALMSDLGGVVTATAADGTVYTLEIPAGALEGETTITITPIGAVANLLLSGPPSGVRLEPSGLRLQRPAILEIAPPAAAGSPDAVASGEAWQPARHRFMRWARAWHWLRATRGHRPPPVDPPPPDEDAKRLGFIFDDDGSDFEVLPVTSAGGVFAIEVAHFSAAGTATGTPADFAASLQPLIDALPPTLPPTQVSALVSSMVSWLEPAPGEQPSFDLCSTTTLCQRVFEISMQSLLAHRDQMCAQSMAFVQAGEPFLAREALKAATQIGARLLELSALADQVGVAGFEFTFDAGCMADCLTAITDVASEQALANPRAGLLALLPDLAGDAALLELADVEAHTLGALRDVLNTLVARATESCLTDPDVSEVLLDLIQTVFPDDFLDAIDPGLGERRNDAYAGCRIRIAPASPTIGFRRPLQFTGSAAGLSPQDVTWSLESANGSTIDPQSGAFIAGETAGTVVAVATSVADPNRWKRTSVAVISTRVTVSPAAITLTSGATQQFTATVTGLLDTSVTWTGMGIDSSGLFTAGATAGTVIVRATSVEDPLVFAEARITVQSVPGAIFTGRLTSSFRVDGELSTQSLEEVSVDVVARIAADGTATVLSATGTHRRIDLNVVCTHYEASTTISGGRIRLLIAAGLGDFIPSGSFFVSRRSQGDCNSPIETIVGVAEIVMQAQFRGPLVYQGDELTAIDFNRTFSSHTTVFTNTGRLERQP